MLAHSYYPDHLWDNEQRVELKDNVIDVQYGRGSYAPDLIHRKALEFLDSMEADKPFFMWYPTTLPHAELIVPEDSIIQRFRGKFPEVAYSGAEPGSATFRKGGYCTQLYPHATFAAMVTRLDVYVGQIVAKLKEKGLYENTIIIFASDNGPHIEGGADPDFFNSNGIYRGYKRDLYEGGIRVPMIVAWPGHVQAGTETNFICAFWDLMPTMRQIINPQTKPSGNEDGISLLPLLTGRKGQKEHDYLWMLRERLRNGIVENIPDVVINGNQEHCLPGTLNVSFPCAEGESILLYLDMEGIEVSTGSACATGSLEPSYVLLACGLDVELAHGSIRFSLGRYNTVIDVDTVIEKLPAIIKKVRSMSTRKV